MKKVPVKQLKIGTVLAKAVYSTDGSLLFTPGTVVAEQHLKEALDIGIKFVHVRDDCNSDTKKDEVTLAEFRRTVKCIFNKITLTNILEQVKIRQTVNDLLRQVLKERSVIPHLTEVRGTDCYIFSHSVNVCLLSLITGLFLKLKKSQLIELGIAALLHDIGQSGVPKEILYKTSSLSAEEFAEVKKHSTYGYEMLRVYEQLPEAVAITALQHHERLDGSGYPGGLHGDSIGLFARIVGIADVFDALLADRPFRKAFFPHQAVELIIQNTGQFDPEILKVFLENVAIYPMGSMVNLSTGEIGVVVDVNRGQHTRPVVRILFDQNLRKLEMTKEMDLSKYPDLFITKILREDQIETILQ